MFYKNYSAAIIHLHTNCYPDISRGAEIPRLMASSTARGGIILQLQLDVVIKLIMASTRTTT
jgi:hypothetical protein